MADIDAQLKEYEDGFAKSCLDISKARREAQAKLMQAYPRIALNPVEAHGYLNDMYKTKNDPTLPDDFKDYALNLSLEYGYNINFAGLSFAGYAVGPMLIGGLRGQQIARERGSLLAEGVLANDTDEGARLYASHICSYAEYDYGVMKIKVTNPGSGNPIVESEPPGALEELQRANAPG